MTAALARQNPSIGTPDIGTPTPARARSRPELTVLDQAAVRWRSRRRLALTFAFILVLAGFFAVAFVHADLVTSQQQLDQMRNQVNDLETEKAQIQRQIEDAEAPGRIVSRAASMGMVRAEKPVFLPAARSLSDG